MVRRFRSLMPRIIRQCWQFCNPDFGGTKHLAVGAETTQEKANAAVGI
jgi:hypothetical protein